MKTYSSEYKSMQQKLHEKNQHYGRASLFVADKVAALIRLNNFRSLSDYGAGKMRLRSALRKYGIRELNYQPYDIAYPDYGEPKSAELVTCIDVLEHIEPEYLEQVLIKLQEITEICIFISVHTVPAKKILDDGRNAHLILKAPDWWIKKIQNYFDIKYMNTSRGGVEFICTKNGISCSEFRTILKKPLSKSVLSNLRRILNV